MSSKTDQLMQKNGAVLIVDDEPAITDVVSQMLQKLGYGTLETNTGNDAIAIYAGNNDLVDWVVLDLHLGDMDGKMVYEELKSINPAFHVLFMTGGNQDDIPGLKLKGNGGFLQKPFDLKTLISAFGEISETQR